jgi:hypothetical protein
MPVKMNVIAGFLLSLLVASFLAASCSGGNGKEAPPTSTATSAVAPPTPSPFPTARPTLDAAARFGTVHSAPVPASDESTTWMPAQLIPGSRLLLALKPGGSLPCGGCQFAPGDPANPGKLALWNVDTGAVDHFRTLQPGDNLGPTASDGHYLAWVEGCHNAMGDPWNLYAMDLTTRQVWQVDSDFATVSGDPWLYTCPSGIAIANGRLVYSTSVVNLAGSYVDEVRTYDLATHAGSKLTLSGGVPNADIGCGACGTSEGGLAIGRFSPVYALAGQVFWTGSGEENCTGDNWCQTPAALYITDISNGNTRRLAPDLGNGGLLRVLTGSSQGRNERASLWEGYLQVTDAFVAWVDLPENVAMAYDTKSGDAIRLSDSSCSAGFLAADDTAIYWTCDNQLHWVDLPQP